MNLVRTWAVVVALGTLVASGIFGAVAEGPGFELGDAGASLGSDALVAPDPRPSPRAGHRMVYDSESERVILLGGGSPFGSPGTDLNDLWAYDVEDDRWRELRPPVMPPRAGPVPAVGPMGYASEPEG